MTSFFNIEEKEVGEQRRGEGREDEERRGRKKESRRGSSRAGLTLVFHTGSGLSHAGCSGVSGGRERQQPRAQALHLACSSQATGPRAD